MPIQSLKHRPSSSAAFGASNNARHFPSLKSERWMVLSAKIFLAIWVLFYLVYGTKLALWFDGYPVNGPFQIFNPLRRIAAGQVAGRDFVFFHGIGIPYLHYPLFVLFGGNTLAASELSRQWTSIFLFLASLGAFVWVTLRDFRYFWVGAALCILLMEATFPMGASPSHSLISARSTMPIFLFTILQLRVRNRSKALLTGFCMGLAVMLGTEHGISLILALVVFLGISLAQAVLSKGAPKGSVWENIKFALMAVGTAVISAASMFLLLCGLEGTRKALRYALLDLPGDQFWFFGSPPMPYLSSWSELILNHHVILSFLGTYLALVVLGWILVRFRGCPFRLGRDWQALAVVMLVYGILTGAPLLGILSRHYVFPLARTLTFVALLVYANGAMPRWPGRLSPNRWLHAPALATSAVVSILLITSLALAYRSTILMAGLTRHLRNPSSPYNRLLDGEWNSFMSQATRVIDSNRKRSTVSLWSAYSALLEWHYGIFHPAEDYIIHSVGPQRWRHYIDTFRAFDAEFVTTMTPKFSFEEWLQDVRWEFYEDLLNNYRPLKQVEHATIWQRKEGPWLLPAPDFHTQPFEKGGSSVTIPATTSDRLGVVRVRYKVSNPWRRLPLIGLTPRYLAVIEGSPRHLAISFPPYLSEFQFPVELSAKQPLTLRFQTTSLFPAATFRVEEVQLKILPWQPSQKAIFAPI